MKPDINQLIKVISQGVDNIDQRLILKKDGSFELVPFVTIDDAELFEDLEYVMRWGTLDSENDYVGSNAANDSDYINGLYKGAIKGWDKYQSTGRTEMLDMDA